MKGTAAEDEDPSSGRGNSSRRPRDRRPHSENDQEGVQPLYRYKTIRRNSTIVRTGIRLSERSSTLVQVEDN